VREAFISSLLVKFEKPHWGKQIWFKQINVFPMTSFSVVLLIPAVGTAAATVGTTGTGSHFHLRLVIDESIFNTHTFTFQNKSSFRRLVERYKAYSCKHCRTLLCYETPEIWNSYVIERWSINSRVFSTESKKVELWCRSVWSGEKVGVWFSHW
jgi:hypothetical protein